jgi:DNA polymerase III delta subunit
MWLLADAINAGNEGEALRRLADFLEHGHPLVVLAFLEGEVRRRSLAAVAPDMETYAGWVGSAPSSFPVRKVWERRSSTRAESLRRSLDALARADLQIKTAPEPTHRVTLERLTVAMCRWLGR